MLSYPGRTPEGSFVLRDGEVHALPGDGGPAVADRWLKAWDSLPAARRLPVLCLGSNACPPQVQRKLATLEGDRTVVFLRARVHGVRPVYSGHVARYGAIPATGDAGGAARLFVALYTREQLAATFASEHGSYDLCALEEVRAELPGGERLGRAFAFLSTRGVLCLDGGAVPLGALSQEELLQHLLDRCSDAGGVEAADYARRPGRYRRALEGLLREEGLRRPADLPATRVEVEEIEPLGATG